MNLDGIKSFNHPHINLLITANIQMNIIEDAKPILIPLATK